MAEISNGIKSLPSKFLRLTLPPLPAASRLYRFILAAGIIILGLAMAWLPVNVTGLLFLGIVFWFLLLRWPVLSLYLLMPIIPFSSLLAVSLGDFKVGLMEIVLAGGLAAWLLRLSLRHTYQIHPATLLLCNPTALFWPFLIFLGCVSLSWLNTLSIGTSLVETAKWVEMLVVCWLGVNLLPRAYIQWLVAVILLTGLAQATLGLYQFIFKVGPEGFLLFGGRFLRAYGTFAQPNPYAGYLGLVLPLALALAVYQVSGFVLRLSPKGSKYQVASSGVTGNILRFTFYTLPVLSFVLLLAALFASQSRSGWLAFGAAGLVTLIALSKKPALTLAALVMAAALVFLTSTFSFTFDVAGDTAYSVVMQRLADALTITNLGDISTVEVNDANFAAIERLAHWQAARDMWRDHPWLGVGFGNYAVLYPAYAVGRWLNPLGHAHNYLLNLGAETGLVGIMGYLIFWIWAFGVTCQAVWRASGFERAVAVGGLGILVHLHLHNLFDNLYVQGMYLHIAVILTLILIIRTPKNGGSG